MDLFGSFSVMTATKPVDRSLVPRKLPNFKWFWPFGQRPPAGVITRNLRLRVVTPGGSFCQIWLHNFARDLLIIIMLTF